MVFLGAWRVGISTDEPAHVIRFANLQQHGWYLLDDDFVGDEPGPWVTDQYVYAPVTTQVMHAAGRVIGTDPAGALGTSVRAYSVRHLLVALCGLLGVLAVAGIGRSLLGSWRWGLVSAAMLMAIPMWPGLSMFDIKDIPVATGYSLVTLGLVELLGAGRQSRRRSAWVMFLLASGMLMAVGTRPGIWPGIAASIALAGLLAALPGRDSSWSRRFLAPVLLASLVAYAVLWASYPAYFARPEEWLPGSVFDSAGYAGSETGRASGTWAYIPGRVVVVMPPLLLLIGVVGCLAAVPRRLPQVTPQVAGWLLVASQALLLPTLIILRQSLLYGDLRQVLFATPAVALLLTAGWRKFASDLGRNSRTISTFVALTWSAAVLVPVAVQVQLFPYAYAYASPQAEKLGAAVDNDFWRISYRELLPEIPRSEFIMCYPIFSPAGETMRYLASTGIPAADSSSDCRIHPISSLAPFGLAADDLDRFTVRDTFIGLFTRGFAPGSNCRELATIERWRYLDRTVLSTVARCRLVLNAYPMAGLELTPDGLGTEYLLGGWTSHPALPGVQLREPAGSLGFEIPEVWASKTLHIQLDGEAANFPDVFVNNAPVRATATDDGWELDVPTETVAAMGERRLVVTLEVTTDEPLTLTRVTVEPA